MGMTKIIQKINMPDIETDNLLLSSQFIWNSVFLSDYTMKSDILKYMLDSFNNDMSELNNKLNSILISQSDRNHIWMIKRKNDNQILGSFYLYNRDFEYNFAFIYCDILKQDNNSLKFIKEEAEYMCEAISGFIYYLTEEVKIEKLFLPVYVENSTTVHCIEQLGFKKCTDRNPHTQECPHDLYMYNKQ
jgi:RimJ/RimL family protein N-acetyltransferase